MTAVPPAARRWWLVPAALLVTSMSGAALGQVHVPPNSFTPVDDVELGREAAAAIRRQLPVLTDERVVEYVNALGRRLVEAVPHSVRQPAFEYGFTILDLRELTTAALPGGQIFVSRGMLALAPSDDAFAGLVAHELAHVLLRHATAQVSASEQYQVGAIAGHAIAAVLRNGSTNILERASAFAAASYFLMNEQKYERHADRLAVHLMARAGYTPRGMGSMIETIRNEGAALGGALWALRHPEPGDDESASRADLIAEEAARAHTGSAQPPPEALASIQSWLEDLAPALPPPSARDGELPVGTLGYNVVVPSGESRSVTAGDFLQLTVPANWRRLPGGNAVTFAPDGAFLRVLEGPIAFTHGIQVAVARSITGDLTSDLQLLLASFGRGNPNVTWTPAYQRVTIAGREGLTTTLSSVSPATGEFEHAAVWAAHLPDGSFLYLVGIAPQEEAGVYRNAFTRVVESIRIRD